MAMTELEQQYNKFNEEKRLDSRHGRVEFITSMKYIHNCLDDIKATMDIASDIKILDIGAGTGRYSVPLSEEGYDVTAVELVKHNLGLLKAKNSNVKAYQGNALKLKRFEDNTFDMALLFGPMYHLFTFEDKLKALNEAKRVVKPGGIILVAYLMNEYSVITYAFKEGHINECLNGNRLTEDYHTVSSEENLYDYMRIEDINSLNEAAGLERIKILSPDGPANYIRPYLNKLTEEETQKQLATILNEKAKESKTDEYSEADITYPVIKTNEGWKIVSLDDETVKIMSANFKNVEEEVNNSINNMGSSDGSDVASVPEASESDTLDLTTDKFTIKYKKHTVTKDFAGNPCVMIYYDYTNRASGTSSAMVDVSMKAYQHGEVCDAAIPETNDDAIDHFTAEIQSGQTVTVCQAFSLKDESDVTIQVQEAFSMDYDTTSKQILKIK